jgi:hypothetical protein
MSGESDPQFQLLQIETCTSKMNVKTTITQEGNFEFASWTFVGHVNISWTDSPAAIFQIWLGDSIQNPLIKLVEVIQQYTIASRE